MATSNTRIAELAAATPRPDGVKLTYGTAGFRAKADVLPSTFLRMGMLATLRSVQKGQVCACLCLCVCVVCVCLCECVVVGTVSSVCRGVRDGAAVKGVVSLSHGLPPPLARLLRKAGGVNFRCAFRHVGWVQLVDAVCVHVVDMA